MSPLSSFITGDRWHLCLAGRCQRNRYLQKDDRIPLHRVLLLNPFFFSSHLLFVYPWLSAKKWCLKTFSIANTSSDHQRFLTFWKLVIGKMYNNLTNLSPNGWEHISDLLLSITNRNLHNSINNVKLSLTFKIFDTSFWKETFPLCLHTSANALAVTEIK